jgi:HEAT repeat protein
MKDARALPLLRALARAGTPEVRALAVLGLGAEGDRGSTAEVMALVRELDAGDVARAAAAYALGELGVQAATPLLVTLAEDGDPLPRQMALLSLARLGSGQSAKEGSVLAAMADAVFAGGDPESARARSVSESLRRAGAAALTVMAAGGDAAKLSRTVSEQFPVPDNTVQVESMLTALVPAGFSAKDRAAVLVTYPDVLLRAAQTALETSGDRAATVLSALAEGNASFAPFLGAEESPGTAAARVHARAIVRSLEPGILMLVRHPDTQLRIQALGLLASSDTDAASTALVQAVSDTSESVIRVALAALGTGASQRSPLALEAAARVLARQADWSLRVLAAEALGRLGHGPPGTHASDDAAHDLEQAALHDPYALVREASLRALALFDPGAAVTVARSLAADDPEPRVQDVARGVVNAGASSGKPL